MADSTRIIDGSYKGIPIRIDSGSVSGGRKTVKKEFPNRDTQTIEDLGLRPRSYSLQIVVAPRTTVEGGVTDTKQGYFEYRDSLIAALENKGSGTLIHPLYGRIDNVVATSFTLTEDFSDFGRTRIAVTFEVTNDTGIPRQTLTALSQLSQANTNLASAVNSDISNNFNVSNFFSGNFSDAASKINSIVDSAVEATSFIGSAADEINEFNSFIGELSASVNSLVIAPSSLALSINNTFSNIDGLFGTVENTAKAFQNLFGFGGNDEEEVIATTAGRIERQQNRAVLNGAINAQALGYAYVNAAQTQFGNVREIEEAADSLEQQYKRLLESGASDEVISSATDMRVLVQQFFDEQKITAKQIITVYTNMIPARVLSFQYYGESESAEDIINLNNLSDISFVEGDVEILTV